MMSHASATFERYSDDIHKAMRIANREAKWHRHAAIHPLHILIAVVREPTGLGGILLRSKGLDVQRVRAAVRTVLRRGGEWRIFGKIPTHERLDEVINRAVEHAMSERHDAVGTGGILLAMLRHDTTTISTLSSLGLVVDSFKAELHQYLHRLMVEAPDQVLSLDQAQKS